MRWKLLVFTSIAAALVASALWSGALIVFFGPVAVVKLTDWLWPVSLLIPLALSALAGFFVYRHTSRRRKAQAAITIISVLLLTAFACFVAAQMMPKYLELTPHHVSQVAV